MPSSSPYSYSIAPNSPSCLTRADSLREAPRDLMANCWKVYLLGVIPVPLTAKLFFPSTNARLASNISNTSVRLVESGAETPESQGSIKIWGWVIRWAGVIRFLSFSFGFNVRSSIGIPNYSAISFLSSAVREANSSSSIFIEEYYCSLLFFGIRRGLFKFK